MKDDEFVLLLIKSKLGDNQAIHQIIQMYAGLIYKNSYINGKFDEDCRAYIESRLVAEIKKFKKVIKF